MGLLEEAGPQEEEEEEEAGRRERGRHSLEDPFRSLHTGRPSGPSVCFGDDLPHPSQVTAQMLSQQPPDIPYVFTITGSEAPLCRFEIQNRLWFVFAICEPTGLSGSAEPRLPCHAVPERATGAPFSTCAAAGRPTEACAASILLQSQQVARGLEDASREQGHGSSKSSRAALSLRGLQQKAVVTGRPQGLLGVRETTRPAWPESSEHRKAAQELARVVGPWLRNAGRTPGFQGGAGGVGPGLRHPQPAEQQWGGLRGRAPGGLLDADRRWAGRHRETMQRQATVPSTRRYGQPLGPQLL